MIFSLLQDLKENATPGMISLRFHNTLVNVICQMAREINVNQVVLSGGCFQNKFLTEKTVQRLVNLEFHPFWHRRVPTNDGGLALGQVALASWIKKREGFHVSGNSRENNQN